MVTSAGTNQVSLSGNTRLQNTGSFAWSNTTNDASAASDTNVSKVAAGIIAVGNGTGQNKNWLRPVRHDSICNRQFHDLRRGHGARKYHRPRLDVPGTGS